MWLDFLVSFALQMIFPKFILQPSVLFVNSHLMEGNIICDEILFIFSGQHIKMEKTQLHKIKFEDLSKEPKDVKRFTS